MADKILAKVIKAASLGDIKAARLYFDVIGNLINQSTNQTLIKNQNNYIQINGRVLSQETIKQMTAAQLQLIEEILSNVLIAVPTQS